MKTLKTREDLLWLSEVHWYGADRYALAILFGNEDAPDRIELYARDHYQCKPLVLVADPDTNALTLKDKGDAPLS